MPTTEDNAYLIQRRCSNASIEEIRNAMDELQLIVYSNDCFQTTQIESNGMPPFLETTDGIQQYDCPSNCRKTAAVFSLYPNRTYSRIIGPEREFYWNNKRYSSVLGEGRDATLTQLAQFYFKNNPGTSTEKYYHLYYKKPTRITDLSIELILPEELHWDFRKGVIAMLTTEGYGESQYDSRVVEMLVKKIRSRLNSGYGSTYGVTEWQPEYLDYPGD